MAIRYYNLLRLLILLKIELNPVLNNRRRLLGTARPREEYDCSVGYFHGGVSFAKLYTTLTQSTIISIIIPWVKIISELYFIINIMRKFYEAAL